MNEKKVVDSHRKKQYIRDLLTQFFEICSKRAYTKKQIAAVAGTNFTAVYRWLRGVSLPRSKAIIERIEAFLKENLVQSNTNSQEPETLIS